MKLLKELKDFKYSKDDIVLEENSSGQKVFKLKGIIQRAEATNQNGRVYPKRILEREINNYMRLVKERRALGELDHADDPIVNLKNVSHLMTNIWFEGNDVYGEVEVLPTPAGNILKSLIESNVTVGISSRALGSVLNEAGNDVVQDDLHFVCWDFVSDPSTHGAYMLKEAKEISPTMLKKIISREDRIYRATNDFLKLLERDK
jgi:hypothetical protein